MQFLFWFCVSFWVKISTIEPKEELRWKIQVDVASEQGNSNSVGFRNFIEATRISIYRK